MSTTVTQKDGREGVELHWLRLSNTARTPQQAASVQHVVIGLAFLLGLVRPELDEGVCQILRLWHDVPLPDGGVPRIPWLRLLDDAGCLSGEEE